MAGIKQQYETENADHYLLIPSSNCWLLQIKHTKYRKTFLV